MRLTFHALLTDAAVPDFTAWQSVCRELGFSVIMAADNPPLSSSPVTVSYTWRGKPGGVTCHLAQPSDVADIFDEWHETIRTYALAISFDYHGDDAVMPGALVAAAALIQTAHGALVIESDGVFLDEFQALATACAWESRINFYNQ